MPKDTPAMAKNKMRRCFAAILDPHPSKSEVDSLWEYFEGTCAYCGVKIERASRTGHLDHVQAASDGGSNNIHNHVLSCARCNGDEKREETWAAFLAKKAKDAETISARKMKIETWLSKEQRGPALDAQQKAQVEKIVTTALESFDLAVEQLRKIRRANGT